MLRFVLFTRRGRLDVGQLSAVWRRFGVYARDHVRELALAFGAALIVIAMQLALPLPLKAIFDGVLDSALWQGSGWLATAARAVAQRPAQLLWWACGAILVIAALDALGCYLRDVSLAGAGQRIVGRIRQDLFAHLQTLPPSVFERRKTGALMARLSGDIQMLRQMLVNALIIAGQSVLTVVALSAAMLMISPLLAAIALATVPVSLLASWRISRRIQVATKKQREKESEVAAIAHDVLGAMAVVQAFNREAAEQKRFARENRSTVRAGLKTTRLESQLYRTVSLATALAMCVILFLGVQAVLAGRLTAGDLLVFISYLRMVNKPLRSVAKLTSQLARATACGQRVAELFAIEPAIRNRADARPLAAPRGRIDFQGVTFGYGPGRPVLNDVNLRIEPGARVAIVGPTGAGKSTLIKLLLRFHDPDTGSVGIDGHDLRDVTLESLRRHIGWVHQDTVLFGMSIADNLALGRPDATSEMLAEIAGRVRADEFIERLPKGLATVLGQGGASLSGGQRQRLALGRALLREPGILLLDEPATGLDALTRRTVEEAWLSSSNRATTVVICHRLQAMERFDRVVYLNHGRVDAIGSHQELLSSCPEYAALIAAGQDAPPLLMLRGQTA